MKKYTIIVLLILAIMKTQAQDYLISFAGTGDTSGVNLVKVDNLTSGATVTLNGGDVLHLKSALGIESRDMNNNHLLICPNPMTDHTVLTFTAPDNGDATIGIFNITGKTIYQTGVSVSPGENGFRISGLNQGIYFVIITGNKYKYSTKLMCRSNIQREVKIENVSSGMNTKSDRLKSISTTIDMPYTTGDLLLFKGTGGQFGTVITDVPSSSKTITFNFVLCKDNLGNNYSTVQIGTQVWMAENLKATRYSDGTSIPLVTDSATWSNSDTPGYCWYNNDTTNQNTYGALYNWYTVNTAKLAPAGWHIPTDAEWTTLTTYLGGESSAGGKLKETDTTHWRNPNAGATNETGFTALPGGHRDVNGTFSVIGDDGFWWSATEYGTTGKVWYRSMDYNYAGILNVNNNKKNGHSIRCIRDSGGFSIGQNYGGGIIFYIDSTGQHGLISATNDQGTGVTWGCDTTLIGGTSTGIGMGQANTTAIVNVCSQLGIAARICEDLVLNGYSDWFLPSMDELNQMYLQKSVIGSFNNDGDYWSSSEWHADSSFGQNFGSGGQYMYYKYDLMYVRAIRAF